MYAAISKPDQDSLFATAEGQDGYFTMSQALEAGFGRSTQSYHVKAGNWSREHRGIYRLRQFPHTANDHLVPWSLWSRNKKGKPQGVYSHTTALALRDLSDANPSKLHITVPLGFRRNSETPPVLILHKAHLEPHEIVQERGFAVTTVMRAILDSAESGDADPEMLRQALKDGTSRGLVTRAEIRKAKQQINLPSWLAETLKTIDS